MRVWCVTLLVCQTLNKIAISSSTCWADDKSQIGVNDLAMSLTLILIWQPTGTLYGLVVMTNIKKWLIFKAPPTHHFNLRIRVLWVCGILAKIFIGVNDSASEGVAMTAKTESPIKLEQWMGSFLLKPYSRLKFSLTSDDTEGQICTKSRHK